MSVGENIQFFREKLNLTRLELANKLSVDESTIFRCETNETKPSVDTVIKLAKALHVTTDALLLSPTDQKKLNSTNTVLAKQLKAIEKLNYKDQKALIQIIEAFLKSKK